MSNHLTCVVAQVEYVGVPKVPRFKSCNAFSQVGTDRIQVDGISGGVSKCESVTR